MKWSGRFMAWLQQFMWSCWKFPVLTFGLGFAWSLLLGAGALYDSWSGGAGIGLEVVKWVLMGFGFALLGLWVMVGLWPWVMTVLCCMRREWRHLLKCWACVLGAGMVCWVACVAVLLLVFRTDLYMQGVTLPEEREYVAPRGLRPWVGDVPPVSERVDELLSLRPVRPPVEVLVQMPALPNLEKLTREAPEILREYVLRCLYAEATDPRFDAQVLCLGHDAVLLAHDDEPQSLMLRNPESVAQPRTHLRPKRSLPVEKKEETSASWQMPLHSGWSVVLNRDYVYTDWLPAEEQVAGPLRRLDESLAPLAANPTCAGLDALLPPLPQAPFLCLWCADFAGEYRALVVLPPGYPDCVVELRARELSTGKPVDCSGHVTRARSLDALGRVMMWHSLRVRSGSVNEFYATEWEIWFTPVGGGEERCVGRQEFLMMGGE